MRLRLYQRTLRVTCGGGFPEACFVWLSIVGQRGGLAMRTIGLRADYRAETVRMAAAGTRDAAQARRLLSIAAVYEGMNRRSYEAMRTLRPVRSEGRDNLVLWEIASWKSRPCR